MFEKLWTIKNILSIIDIAVNWVLKSKGGWSLFSPKNFIVIGEVRLYFEINALSEWISTMPSLNISFISKAAFSYSGFYILKYSFDGL